MKKLTAYLMVVLLGITCLLVEPAQAQEFACSGGNFVTNPANGHQYCLTNTGPWSDAKAEGDTVGGYLVTVNDQAEQDWLAATFGNTQRYWIGFSDAASEGNFVWVNGETPAYTSWLPQEPNNGNCYANEHYAVLNGWGGSDSGWNDLAINGYWQDCSATSGFCGQKGTPQSVPAVCQIGFKLIPGIVEIPTPPTPPTPPAPPVVYTGSINGVKWNDLNSDGIRDSIVKGDKPDVVMVMDMSWSTILSKFQGSPVGDVNNDGSPDDILDAQLAGFMALNQQLIDQGFGDTARVGIVAFSIGGYQVDMDPVTPGKQLVTNPAADKNGNGVSDVEEILAQVKIDRNYPYGSYQSYVAQAPTNIGGCYVGFPCRSPGGGTNFEPGLALAKSTFQAVSTESGNANIIFLSDGVPGGGAEGYGSIFEIYQTNYIDEVGQLKAIDANISAFGVGDGAALASLQKIDEKASIFTTTDKLLSVFGGLDSGSASATAAGGLEPGLSNVTVFLDLNNNGTLDNGEPSQVTDKSGAYHFTGLEPGDYAVREVVPGNFKQTAPASGMVRITLGANEAVNNVNFGNVKQ